MKSPTPISDQDLDRLFASARSQRLDTSALEYAFETRLLARLPRHAWLDFSTLQFFSWRFIPLVGSLVLVLAFWYQQESLDADLAQTDAYANTPSPVLVLNDSN